MMNPCRPTASLVLALAFAACGNASPPLHLATATPSPSADAAAAPAPGDPPDSPVPSIRSGSLAPVEATEVIEAKLVDRHLGPDGVETVVAGYTPARAPGMERAVVAVDGGGALYSFLEVGSGSDEGATGFTRMLYLRRPASLAGTPLEGDLFVAADYGSPGEHRRFRIADTRSRPSDPKALERWLRAFARISGWSSWTMPRGAWQRYSSQKALELADAMAPPKRKGPRARAGFPGAGSGAGAQIDLAELMDTTTGAMAVQEALQPNRTLFVASAKQKATVPLASLHPPPLASHPWKQMNAKLAAPAPAEPLAADAPADFYYLRSRDLSSLFRLLDAIDDWGTPAASIETNTFEDRGLAARYEAQLGLRRSALARALGDAVVGEVGLVGSDPYVKEGSDVTLLFRVKNRALFDAALSATLADFEGQHGTLARATRTHGNVKVATARSGDGAVRQERATVGDLDVVSNSPAAMNTVLDTVGGSHARLADEDDFKFMLARDADVASNVLAYMSDRFVAAVVGPRQKVLEARRQIALSELLAPGFASLFYGWLEGKAPEKNQDLFARGLLAKEDLVHASGAPIDFAPGRAATSSWGSAAALTPLIDLPSPDRVTESERAGYERFAAGYQSNWSAYIDPVALRIAFDGPTMAIDLRQLPLIDGTDYHRLDELVGKARFKAGRMASGARGVIAIGEDAWPRHDAEDLARTFARHELKFDWLGDWAMIGVADRTALAEAVLADGELGPRLERPDDGDDHSRHDALDALPHLPLYAAIGIKNAAGAALALAGLRVVADQTIPGMFEWGEVDRYRDVPIVRILIKEKGARGLVDLGGDFSIFYAVTGDALIVSLKDWVLRHLIDDRLDGRGPDPVRGAGAGSMQALFDLGASKDKGLWSALAWLTEAELFQSNDGRAAATAEAILRGAPECGRDAVCGRGLAVAYFGANPVAVDGGTFTLDKDGIHDPARGSAFAPAWPALPVPGSPVDRVFGALAHVRSELSFDDEGEADRKKMRSLHARVVLETR